MEEERGDIDPTTADEGWSRSAYLGSIAAGNALLVGIGFAGPDSAMDRYVDLCAAGGGGGVRFALVAGPHAGQAGGGCPAGESADRRASGDGERGLGDVVVAGCAGGGD